MKKYFYLFGILILFSCKKEPGDGGNARIYGKIMAADYNSDFSVLISEFPATDTYVYIKYGASGEGFDDRVKTDYNGTYSFDFLYPGKYELYIYSRDSTMSIPGGEAVIRQTVEINERKEEKMAQTMTQLR